MCIRDSIETIAKKLRQYDAKHIVVDPVMVATSGSKLLQDSAIQIPVSYTHLLAAALRWPWACG